jgi:PAS domain S-box-containing protein
MQNLNTSDLFNFLAEKSLDVIKIFDADLKCIFVNDEITKHTGLKPEDIQGKPFNADKFFGKTDESYYKHLLKSRDTLTRIETECSIVTLSGERYFRVLILPKTSGDTVEYIFVIFRDVTEVKKKEKLVVDFNSKFLTAAEVLLQPLVIMKPVMNDNEIIDFEYDFINEAGCIANGVPREETVGKTMLELYPAHKSIGSFEALKEVFLTGVPWKDVVKYEGPGGFESLAGYFTMSAARTADGIVVTWQDITQSVNAQNDLKKSEERLYRAFNSNPVPMVLTDHEGRIININKSFKQLLSYSKKEIVKKTIGEINLFDDSSDFQKTNQSILSGEQIDKYFTKIRNRDGNLFQVIFSSTLLENSSGDNYLLTFVDITKQKELETSLLESLHEKDVLLKEIHHRVKNNLQIISSLLNLQSGVTDDPTSRAIISETQNRVQSIALMHENLYKNKSLSAIKLDDYVKDMLGRIHQTYDFPGKVVTSSVEISNINIDLKQCLSVGLILNELITNAYKYAFINRPRGEIRICANLKNDNLELTVADNGNGLPDGFNIESQSSLGLQLVTILTNQLDGNIKCKNNGGAEFKILFPLND